MKKPMKRTTATITGHYALYCRCSTDEQADGEFTTLDAQKAITTRHVLSLGGTVAGCYNDAGKTGTNLNRSGWKALLADAQAGLFDGVCITYMSRLGRGDAVTIAEYLLQEAGVEVVSVHEQYADDEASYVKKVVDRMVDGMYIMQVRKHTTSKMQEMFAQGFVCGHVPFGYAKEAVGEPVRGKDGKIKEPPQRAVRHEEYAAIVQHAFALYLETGTAATVCDFLRAATGRKWSISDTTRLLADERYTGVALFGQWRKEDAHPAIVERETWQAAQTRVRATAARYTVRHDDDFTYYLHGRVFCPHCGCPFTQAAHKGRSKRIHYYVCRQANKRNGRGMTCPVVRVNAEHLHTTVLGCLRRASSHHTVMHNLIAESGGWGGAEEALKALRGQMGKQKQALEMRIGNYIKAIGEGRDSPALMAALDKAEAERAALIEQMADADNQIAAATVKRPLAGRVQEAWGRLLEVWDVLDESERAELLGAVVQRVEATDKESVMLDLLPFPTTTQTSHSQRFALTQQVGAGQELIVNHAFAPGHQFAFAPDFLSLPIAAFHGGLSRKKVPRAR